MASGYTWPTLPGLALSVERSPIYSTDVFYTVSGKRQTVSWESTPRYRFRLTYEILRDNVQAPAPLAAYTELDAVILIIDTCRGEWDTFTYVDPVDGTSRTCALSDAEPSFTQIGQSAWSVSLEIESVK